jgi:hypothetical protein
MRTTVTTLPIYSIRQRKDRIDPKPQYQRGPVWPDEKKQLLIDTVIRGYDIPKFYLRMLESSDYESEVVDGQQRLRAIWSFMNNEFPLGHHSKDVNGHDLEGKLFQELSSEFQDVIGGFSLSITELRDASDIEVRELFLRLQEGSTLTPPAKRNAMVSNMRDFVHDMAHKPLLAKTTAPNNRFQHDDYAAHACRLEVAGGPADLKAADLKKFYEQENDFDENSSPAKKIKKVFNYLDRAFEEPTPELKIKWGFIDLYLLTTYLLDNYAMRDRHEDIFNFYIGWETTRKEVEDESELLSTGSAWDRDLYDYIEAFKTQGATRTNLEKRQQIYLHKFLNDYPDLVAKDERRAFSQSERMVIWRKASMKCENPDCDTPNQTLELEDMHADHVTPHSAGGKTSIDNAQCLCAPCNLAKSDG